MRNGGTILLVMPMALAHFAVPGWNDGPGCCSPWQHTGGPFRSSLFPRGELWNGCTPLASSSSLAVGSANSIHLGVAPSPVAARLTAEIAIHYLSCAAMAQCRDLRNVLARNSAQPFPV